MTAALHTIADARFFPGVVSLLNSLRLTGNTYPLVVLDRGLTAAQRSRLEPHVRFVDVASDWHPVKLKAYPHLLETDGVAIVIDSDMLVTGSLDAVVDLTARGKIGVFRDHPWAQRRFFPVWESALKLRAPLRCRVYRNAGFVAVSTELWPEFLERWWELCAAMPDDLVVAGTDSDPFRYRDQDVLNALLSSEIPDEAVADLPGQPDLLLETRVDDAQTLRCSLGGVPQTILHASQSPKPWEPGAWRRLRADAYVRLLPRVLLAEDVTLRLEPSEVPPWLRRTVPAAATVRAIDAYNWSRWGLGRVARVAGRAARREPLRAARPGTGSDET